MPYLEVKNVSFVYSEKTPFERVALKNISFSLELNSTLGVIGHTGSGKSTLMQLLNGLLRPNEGQILIDGEDVFKDKISARAARFKVGLVFQYPEYQLFDETVKKDIAFGPKNMGISEDEIERRVLRAAQTVGLAPELLEKSPFDLSGGEKRRAAIAGVLAMGPKVLILDEPTAGLDPRGREKIMELVSAYREKTGAAVIFVSHNMEDIAQHAEKVLVLNNSSLAMFDTTKEVFSREKQLQAMGLALPSVTAVFSLLKKKGLELPDGIYTIERATAELKKLMLKRGNENGA